MYAGAVETHEDAKFWRRLIVVVLVLADVVSMRAEGSHPLGTGCSAVNASIVAIALLYVQELCLSVWINRPLVRHVAGGILRRDKDVERSSAGTTLVMMLFINK